MLTEAQEKYLAKIPEDVPADIQAWDSQAAEFAKRIVERLEKVHGGMEVFWGGSLALGILGQNDIDLTLFAEPNEFETLLPEIVFILGEPTYKLKDKILWRIRIDGYKLDAYLGSKSSEGVQNDLFFSDSLKNDPSLLSEYKAIKEQASSAREYYRQKNEFYNRVIALRK